jgi:putative membrane protein
MKNPKWIRHFLTEAEVHEVGTHIAAAEEKTTGEIVPMIVRRSTGLGHLGLQIFTLFALLILSAYLLADKLQIHIDSALGSYGHSEENLIAAMVAVVIAWPLAELLARLPALQRAFTLPMEREAQVHARALVEFYASGFQKTSSHTGILIFLSLMEKKCVVIADEGISSKLPDDTWKGLVEKIIDGIRDGRTADGLTRAIKECGEILAKHFPAKGAHQNEISNQLLIKE